MNVKAVIKERGLTLTEVVARMVFRALLSRRTCSEILHRKRLCALQTQ